MLAKHLPDSKTLHHRCPDKAQVPMDFNSETQETQRREGCRPGQASERKTGGEGRKDITTRQAGEREGEGEDREREGEESGGGRAREREGEGEGGRKRETDDLMLVGPLDGGPFMKD